MVNRGGFPDPPFAALSPGGHETVALQSGVGDAALRVRSANSAFYLTFRVNRQETQGRLLYALGDGQWDIPALRALLADGTAQALVSAGSTGARARLRSCTSVEARTNGT